MDDGPYPADENDPAESAEDMIRIARMLMFRIDHALWALTECQEGNGSGTAERHQSI
ncbi:MAG: hypothetical protein LBV13_00260 [Methanomassiliicoccaceae archaeon]|jgi:hypothetical protein|nr:hypothetical protein [Methanomassiliicoccaceae archaeon]